MRLDAEVGKAGEGARDKGAPKSETFPGRGKVSR